MSGSRRAPSIKKHGGAAYRQIADFLRGRIAGGEFNEGGRLPTEDELMAEYGVSRHTTRAALSVLVADGLIERFAGRGTFLSSGGVAEAPWRIRSLDDLVNESFTADPAVLETCWLQAKSDREAAVQLSLASHERMLRITAVRHGQEGPISCSEIFLPREIGSSIQAALETGLGRQSVVRLIEARLGIRAIRAIQTLTMRTPPDKVSDAIGEERGQMTIALLRTYFADDGLAFEFSRFFGKPGRFATAVEFVRAPVCNS